MSRQKFRTCRNEVKYLKTSKMIKIRKLVEHFWFYFSLLFIIDLSQNKEAKFEKRLHTAPEKESSFSCFFNYS